MQHCRRCNAPWFCKPRASGSGGKEILQAALRSWKESLDHSWVRVGLDWLSLLSSTARWAQTMSSFASVSSCRLPVLVALERSLQQLIDTLPLRQQRVAVVERLERLRCMGSLTRQRVLAVSGRE